MKKIIFLLAISICSFMSNAQTNISGVAYYESLDWFNNHYENGNVVEFDYYVCNEDSIYINIDFEQEDNYSATNASLTKSNWGETFYGITLPSEYLWDDDTIKVYGENQGLIIQFVGRPRAKELKSIRVSTSNKIEGDTIFICSDYGTDYIKYNFDAYSYGYMDDRHYDDSVSLQVGQIDHFGGDELFHGSYEFHVNDTVFSLDNSINDFNLKTGDVIKLQSKYRYDWYRDNYGCEWQYSDTISSPELIVKIVENERLDLIDTLGDFYGGICPGESVMLIREKANFKWYYPYNSSYSYQTNRDSFLIKTPGRDLLIEDLPWNSDKQCPAMSQIVKVESKSDCKGYVNGYVRQNTPKIRLRGIMVSTDKGQTTVSDENGFYEFYFDMDDAPTYAVISQDGYYEDKENLSFYPDFKLDEIVNLYTYKLEENDLAIHLNSGRNRPGFTIVQFVTLENRGKNELTTDVQVNLDAALTYTTYEGENQPNSVMGNELKWNNITVASGETKRLKFWAVLDRLTPLETVLSNTGVLLQAVPDDVTSNDTTVYEPVVTGSYDPNDKLVSYQGAYTEGYVYDTTNFEYTIRFQNTGTDTAFNILVTDPISSHLDLSTLKMLDASHNYEMTIVGDTIKWFFPNILLADSFVNEPLSHGFIRFTIDQKENNEQGTNIENTAYIYFDFNDPIITNTTSAIVDNGMVTQVKEVKSTNFLHKLTTYPVPTESEVFFEGVEGGYIEVYDLQGKLLRAENFNNSINVSELNSGVYQFKIITGDKSYAGNIIRK